MLRRLTLGLAFLSAIALTASAMAAPPNQTVRPDIRSAQAEVRSTLAVFDLGVTAERVAFGKRGRRDVVLTTRADQRTISDQMIAAYRTERALPNGFKVAGWAHMAQTDTFNFTLKKGDTSYVVEVAAAGPGANVKIWGSKYDRHPRNIRAINTVPRRYAPVGGDYIVR